MKEKNGWKLSAIPARFSESFDLKVRFSSYVSKSL